MTLRSSETRFLPQRYLSRETDHLGAIGDALRGLIGYATLAYELIQNADDAGAHSVTFDVRRDQLIVENDGIFTDCSHQDVSTCPWLQDGQPPCDFHSFRLVASGAKRERADTTGAFGIGFVAVYQITDRPELCSVGRHWLVDETREAGERIAECAGCERCKGVEGTRFYLPWASDPESPLRRALRAPSVEPETPEQLVHSLVSVLPTTLLFLRHIDRIELREEGEPLRAIKSEHEGAEAIISDGDSAMLWRLETADFRDAAEGLRQRYGDFRIEKKRQSVVTVAIPGDGSVTGLLCAYLPTEHETGFPFHINADFFTSPDRKRVLFEADYQAKWNRMALDAAGRALRSVLVSLPDLLGPVRLWELIRDVWKAKESAEASIRGSMDRIWHELRRAVVGHRAMFTAARTWSLPHEAALLDLDEEEVRESLPILGALGIAHVHPDLQPILKELQWQKSLGVQSVTLDLVVQALRDAGFEERVAPDRLPAPLAGDQGRLALWRLLLRLLKRRRGPGERRAEELLAGCAIAPGRDGALWPCTSLYSGDPETVALFERLTTDIPFLELQLPTEALELLEDLCPRFDVPAALEALEAAAEDIQSAPESEIRGLLAWLGRRRDEFLEDETLKSRLRGLPIYPSRSGLRPLSDLYLPGGFNDPLGLAEVLDVGAVARHQGVLEDLGARQLTFDRYAREFIPRAFLDRPVSGEQTRQLVAFLARHIGELKGDAAAREALAPLPLVECTDGSFRRPSLCYYPGDLAARVLGPDVPVAVLSGKAGAVEDLYEWLGVARRPRARDVLEVVRSVISEPPTDSSRQRIDAVLGFLGRELRDENELPALFTPLRRMKWLPAEGDDASWWAGDDIYTKFNQSLFASQARFLAIPYAVQRESAHALELLGVETRPPPHLVVAHLLYMAERGNPVGGDVYEFLDEKWDDPSVRDLKGRACLFIDGSYFRPDQVFWEAHTFGGYRRTLAPALRRFGRLFELLEVRSAPDHRDAIDVLREIAARFGRGHQPLEQDEDRAVLLACWRMLERALEDEEVTAGDLQFLGRHPVVPDSEWLLREPEDVVFGDVPNVADKFPALLARHLIEPRGGMTRAMRAAGVANLAERLEIEITELEGARDDQHMLALLDQRSGEIRRVIETALGSSAWGHAEVALRSLRPVRADFLQVQYSLAFRGEVYAGAVESVVAHYTDSEEKLYVVPVDGSFSWPAVARELGRALTASGEHLNQVVAPIYSILSAPSPQEASRLLDELGYARVKESDVPPAAGAVAEEVGSGGVPEEFVPELSVPPMREADDEEVGPPGGPRVPDEQSVERTPGDGQRAERSGGVLRTYVLAADEKAPSAEAGVEGAEHRSEVEQAGVNHVIEYERRAGRDPEVMPAGNPGFDIRSRDNDGRIIRYIEVKSMSGTWDLSAAGLTRPQFKLAEERRDEFWLYVVEAALSEEPRLYRIQNPAVRATQFLFDDGWRALSESDANDSEPPSDQSP